jgi:predicted DNA-binding transcriptional regulator AlpA
MSTSRQDPPYLSISEAAARKGITRATFYKYLRRGAFTLQVIVGRPAIVNDARFRAWQLPRRRRAERVRA